MRKILISYGFPLILAGIVFITGYIEEKITPSKKHDTIITIKHEKQKLEGKTEAKLLAQESRSF